MTREIALGLGLVVTALGLLTYLVLWSRRAINHIARRNPASAREVQRTLDDAS